MAKKKTGISKTQLILNALAKSPNATPKEIAESLKAYKITPGYVSTIKFTKGAGKKSKKERGRNKATSKKATRAPNRAASTRGGDGFAIEELLAAKRLSEQLGGIDRAKELLHALGKIQD